MRLSNKVAIITGAASGMGRAMAELFVKEGASVVVTDISPVDGLVKELEKQGKITGIQTDMAIEADINKLVDTAIKTYGKLDILVNNAGIMDGFFPAAEVSDELWDKVIGVNLTGPFKACRKALPVMINQGGGVIINVASIGGIRGGRAGAAYTSSKFGLIGLTQNIAYMYADKKIRSVVICPGGVNTNIMAGVNINQAGMDRTMAGIANNPRMGEPMEIATLALFLASDDASFVNGSVIVADGGWTAY